ncbi:uncharacterized protein LOC110223780 isoform X2 [Phascolarctos cinereus]
MVITSLGMNWISVMQSCTELSASLYPPESSQSSGKRKVKTAGSGPGCAICHLLRRQRQRGKTKNHNLGKKELCEEDWLHLPLRILGILQRDPVSQEDVTKEELLRLCCILNVISVLTTQVEPEKFLFTKDQESEPQRRKGVGPRSPRQ